MPLTADIFSSPHLLHLRPALLVLPILSHLVPLSHLRSFTLAASCLPAIFIPRSSRCLHPPPHLCLLCFFFLLFPCFLPSTSSTDSAKANERGSQRTAASLLHCTRCSQRWSRLQPVGTHNSWNGSKRHAGGAVLYFGCSRMCNWACTLHSLCLSCNHCFGYGPLSWSAVRENTPSLRKTDMKLANQPEITTEMTDDI